MSELQDIFSKQYYLTDGGFETTLVFHKNIELNHFASFELLNSVDGCKMIREYFQPYMQLARKYNLGFIMETATWRSNPVWGELLGYTPKRLSELNKQSVLLLRDIIQEYDQGTGNWPISGCIGPRGDGYVRDRLMTVTEARQYHLTQVQDFAYADVDVITAMTINYAQEAAGIVAAAQHFGIPVVISFTLETDGKLSGGENLSEVIEMVDDQTNGYASHYMINCAHPSHFIHLFEKADGYWIRRIRGIRANASCKSHEELDNSETLDTGDKQELASGYSQLMHLLPNLKVVGGCCGTDHTHLEQICKELFGGEGSNLKSQISDLRSQVLGILR